MAAKDQTQEGLTEKVLFVNRCSKVTSGGRKFSFSALVVVGDNQGRVGFGFEKANELTDAIRKGGEAARKSLIKIRLHNTTIPHEILQEWDGAAILMQPCPEGTGVIAGSYVRAILELAGIKDIMAKSLGANNPINVVRATFKALSELRAREEMKETRGMAS